MFSKLRIRLQDDFLLDRFIMHIQDVSMKYDDRSIALVTDMTVTKFDRYTTIPRENENFSMQREQAVELMNDLWAFGIRPTAFKGENSGEIAAYKAHIADLQMVIKKLVDAKTIAGEGTIRWTPDPAEVRR
jgi:hypothetical protein